MSTAHVVIVTGDTVRLIGNDNTASPANNALYVNGNLALQHNATLNLNTRNAYLNGQLSVGNSPGTATVSGGRHVLGFRGRPMPAITSGSSKGWTKVSFSAFSRVRAWA